MSPVATENPHLVLGLAPTAEPEVVQGAYRALAMKYHPDRNSAGGQRMKAINAAYEILKDPVRRRDWELRQPRPRPTNEQQSNTNRRQQTRSYSSPPRPNHRGASCPQHPYSPNQGICSYCGSAMCAFCPGWRRLFGGKKPLCSDCRAGQLESRLLMFWSVLLIGSGLRTLVYGHWGSSLLLAYPAAALPSGSRLWNRVALSPHGKRIKAWLDVRAMEQRQKWALTVLRWVAPILLGIFICPIDLFLTSGLLALEVYRGGYGLGWWRLQPSLLIKRLNIKRKPFA
ncbi:MAG: J domain-containing protein [Candidatus Dormibacteraceae bacterium]